MKRTWAAIGFCLAGLACMAQEQALTIEGVAAIVLRSNGSIRQSLETLRSAAAAYNLLLADKRPQIGLTTGYSHSYSNYLVNSSGYELSDFGVDTVSMGLSLRQLLGTSGRLSLNLNDQVLFYSGDVASYYDPSFVPLKYGPLAGQSPAVSLSLDQPLFVTDRLIDTEPYQAVFRRGRIEYLQAVEQNRIARNEAVFGTIGLLFDVTKARNNLAAVTKAVDLAQAGIESLERKLKAGLVSELDVWEMRVEKGKRQEELLSCQYALEEKQGELRSALGLEEEVELSIDLASLDRRLALLEDGETSASLPAGNPEIRIAEMGLQKEELKRSLDGAAYAANLNLTLDFSPHYSELRPYLESSATFWDSFSDFWDSDSGWTAALSLSLNIPLYDGSKAKEQRIADDASVAALGEQVAGKKRDLLQKLRLLALMDRNLQQRIAVMGDCLQFERRQVDVGRDLAKIGRKSELDLLRMEIECLQTENELAAAKMDLYLTRLNRRAQLGEDLEGAAAR